MGSGDQTQVLTFGRQAPYHLSQLPPNAILSGVVIYIQSAPPPPDSLAQTLGPWVLRLLGGCTALLMRGVTNGCESLGGRTFEDCGPALL